MTFMLEPELGVPVPTDIKHMDLAKRAAVAFASAIALEEHGADLTPNAEDKDIAAQLASLMQKIQRKHPRKQTTPEQLR